MSAQPKHGLDPSATESGSNTIRRQVIRWIVATLVLGVLSVRPAMAQGRAEPQTPLPAIGADLAGTTVSGFSSGAFMAGQVQLALADIVTGAGLLSGGPWGCAETVWSRWPLNPFGVDANVRQAIDGCMAGRLAAWGIPNPTVLAARALGLSAAGAIGRPGDIRRQRVYIYHGERDEVVAPAVARTIAPFYRQLGIPAGNIQEETERDAGHGFPTPATGGACASSAAPWINACGTDVVGAMLAHVLASRRDRQGATGAWMDFDQGSYADDDARMAQRGLVYRPAVCGEPGCRVHVVFHGCKQSRKAVGETFVKGSGYAEWADAYRLVLLFPEVDDSKDNPHGCWDWWGYTGHGFLTRDAPQIRAVAKMLQRLADR
jgi:poly(3-hydroxybutyrate) depolymerase